MSTDSAFLRATLRADLITAMKARDSDAVAALRTAIAAIDNAEAVDRPDGATATTSEHFAGAHLGVGSTEVARRNLTIDDVHAILQEQMAERSVEADRYDQLGRREAAARLRREANALAKYVPS
jgi:uncharacterized protein YqeY